ncbi:hypothetical protein JZ751_005976 [Albula glossodonta]|uniref:Uncharacterized protein n=1 Tax=Albula glossodonta TaxID=121402 RepID=A0A8T2P426_9TELE|nr:hypothetical protein JZ751_005976 [Albula glossodonta]
MEGGWMAGEEISGPVVWLLSALAALLITLFVWRMLMGRLSSSSLPCLPYLPLVGSLLSLQGDLPPHLLFASLGRKYGDLFALYVGPHYTVVVNNFRHAREVLLQRGKEFAGRPKMVTTELLSREGKDIAFADYSPLWKSHRRLVHSSFAMFGEGTSKLQNIVCEEATKLCSALLATAGQPLDPGPVLMRAVTNVVCTLVFSSTYQPHDPELKVVMDYNDGIVQTIARGGLVDIFPWLKIFPNKDLKRLKECIRVRDDLLNRKLEEHKGSYRPEDTRDLLDALLKGQHGSGDEASITDDHVLMTAAEAFGAGVETTSTTLLWVLAFLLHHPEVFIDMERVGYIPDGGDQAPGHSIGGNHIPKGTRVLINMWSIHHDPQQWEEPERFKPERFLDSEGHRSSPPYFLPFGAGPRVCVGESLAKLELFLFVSWLLQRFTFTLPPGASLPDLQGRFGVVLQPLRYTLAQLQLSAVAARSRLQCHSVLFRPQRKKPVWLRRLYGDDSFLSKMRRGGAT